jgi:gamma-glutamyl phosphate reductase
MKCPNKECNHVWLYTGESTMRICCPKCGLVIYGQKIGLCELTVDQYADLKGMAILTEAQRKIDDLCNEIDDLRAVGLV